MLKEAPTVTQCEPIFAGGIPYGDFDQKAHAFTLVRALVAALYAFNANSMQTIELFEDLAKEIPFPHAKGASSQNVGNYQQSIGFSTQEKSSWRQR
jgi:hypothetical protein